MDANYGFGLLKRALAEAIQAGLIRKQNIDALSHILHGGLTEIALMVARSSVLPKREKKLNGHSRR